jgi:hypothetical protein
MMTNKAPKSKLVVVGATLVLCLPVFGVAAGLYCRFVPREYYAQTTIEFRRSDPDELRKAFSVTAPPSRESASLENVRNTSLYDIGVYDLDPQEAANRANTIAETIRERFDSDDRAHASGAESDPAAAIKNRLDRAVKIWARAAPPVAPSRPNVFIVMFLALAPGLLLAGLGGVLLIVGPNQSAPEMA